MQNTDIGPFVVAGTIYKDNEFFLFLPVVTLEVGV